MHIGIIDQTTALSGYAVELLRAWGLRTVRMVSPADPLDPAELPVLIVPAMPVAADPLLAYARDGGILICFAPGAELAAAAGLQHRGAKSLPAMLRMSAFQPAGLAGEQFPIVGQAIDYAHDDNVDVLGYLGYLHSADQETTGLSRTAVGRGQIIVFAFDLPRCVLMLRQGDPALTEQIPRGDVAVRPSHLACRLPAHDAGWIPYADLLALLLLDLAAEAMPAPLPRLAHLPDEALSLLLYSGDEDMAAPEETQDEFDWLASQGARMDLNVMPDTTPTTPKMMGAYRRQHDMGPHPNLRPLDGQDMQARLADFDRQLRAFSDIYGFHPTCLRNHSLVWAGYTEIVEVMERHGYRMDTNYTSGNYRRGRQYAPYATFGGAIPVRFCRADGRMHDLYQQHTHIMDDVWFAPDAGVYKRSDYSYRFSPEAFEVIADRIFTDLVARLHTPLTVCIHPSNWARFSRFQGQALVRHAQQRGMPVWSVTQWCDFWEARDGWEIDALEWRDGTLRVRLHGGGNHDALRLALPIDFHGARLQGIEAGGGPLPYATVTRHRRAWALCAVSDETLVARYA